MVNNQTLGIEYQYFTIKKDSTSIDCGYFFIFKVKLNTTLNYRQQRHTVKQVYAIYKKMGSTINKKLFYIILTLFSIAVLITAASFKLYSYLQIQ